MCIYQMMLASAAVCDHIASRKCRFSLNRYGIGARQHFCTGRGSPQRFIPSVKPVKKVDADSSTPRLEYYGGRLPGCQTMTRIPRILTDIRYLVDRQAEAEWTDRQLLKRFAHQGDDQAFSVLVRRHG